MRSVLSRASIVLVLLYTSSCRPVEGPDDRATSQESAPHSAREPRAGKQAATTPAAHSGGRALGMLPEPTQELCVGTLLPPPDACLEVDLTEPNDEDDPLPLVSAPFCGYVQANVSPADVSDSYTFTAIKSDPVLVELSYLSSSSAVLEQVVSDVTGRTLSSEKSDRKGPRATSHAVIQTTADASYSVLVTDVGAADGCQSYALRIDPQFCTDDDEDNDDLEHATQLTWDAHEQVAVAGTLYEGDDDYYEVTTTRADPVLLTGSYTAPASGTVQVRREIYDVAGKIVNSGTGARKQATESFEHWLPASAKGSVLRTRLSPDGTGCASFQLNFDAAACTDAFEDNDQPSEAAPLKLGIDNQATIIEHDDDYYALPSLVGGTCSVTYEIPSGLTQHLLLRVYDVEGTALDSDSTGELRGRVVTLHVAWKDHPAGSVSVIAEAEDACQSYNLRCE